MKSYRLTVAPIVHLQIREQVLYIAQDSIDNALAWEARLQDAIRGLAAFAGYAVDEHASARFGYPLRKFVFEGNYLLHFTVDDRIDLIRVVNFRHGARLPRPDEP